MDTKKLDRWASLLLDTGKRNNLVNFKDTKASTVEIIMPTPEELFDRVESSSSFEVFDPQITDDEDEDYRDEHTVDADSGEEENQEKQKKLNRQGYISTYAKYFLNQGYQVDAVDGSEKICKAASEYVGIPVRNMLFQELDETEKYDGIWACSSILHVPKDKLPVVLQKMSDALKENGVIYTSFNRNWKDLFSCV